MSSDMDKERDSNMPKDDAKPDDTMISAQSASNAESSKSAEHEVDNTSVPLSRVEGIEMSPKASFLNTDGVDKPEVEPNETVKPHARSKTNGFVDPETTGHDWDGIEEFRNPDPSWLRVLFYICVFFALTYWILYPSWPTPDDQGALQWSSTKELEEDLISIDKVRQKYQQQFDKASFEQIFQDSQLLQFAMTGGRSAFNNNCAMCHGIGGGGHPGYPNLTAGAWLWGGSIDDIYTTIKYGIRSGHPDGRDSQMPSLGKDGVLKAEEVVMLAHYVMDIGGLLEDQSNTYDKAKASQLFAANCSSCHGGDGKGNHDVGAPDLTDAIWLYGSDYETIYDVIYNGRGGVMPYWTGKLSDSTIHQLAVYVHQLGGGK